MKSIAITAIAALLLSVPLAQPARADIDLHLWLGAPFNGYSPRLHRDVPRGYWRHDIRPRHYLFVPPPPRFHRYAPPPHRFNWRHDRRDRWRHHLKHKFERPKNRYYRHRLPEGRGYAW